MILQKKYQKLGMIFCKNAQALNKATQGGFFFQKQLKPMGYYSGEKSTFLKQFSARSSLHNFKKRAFHIISQPITNISCE